MLKEVETAFEIGSGKLAWLDNQTKLAVKEKVFSKIILLLLTR